MLWKNPRLHMNRSSLVVLHRPQLMIIFGQSALQAGMWYLSSHVAQAVLLGTLIAEFSAEKQKADEDNTNF